MRARKGTENISIEAAVISVWITMLGQTQSPLISLFLSVLAGPTPQMPNRDAVLAQIEPSLKQAVQLVCAIEVFKSFLGNRSAKNAVAFLYIAFRFMKFAGQSPTRSQSIELWNAVWEKARQFPLVAEEWENQLAQGDLDGWKVEVQEAARRQLRTFKSQLPRIERNSLAVYSKVFERLFGDRRSSDD